MHPGAVDAQQRPVSDRRPVGMWRRALRAGVVSGEGAYRIEAVRGEGTGTGAVRSGLGTQGRLHGRGEGTRRRSVGGAGGGDESVYVVVSALFGYFLC